MHNISDASFDQLIHVLEGFLLLNVKFKTKLKSLLYETTYTKDSRILSFKQTQNVIWFLLDGLAREIRVDEETYKERTSWFWFEMSFLYNPGFFSQDPSETTIQILEDCKVVGLYYEDWKNLKDTFKDAELVTEKIRLDNERTRNQHSDEIKNLSTEERYIKHEVTLEILFMRTKLKYIAEYMGMAVDTLGKLRKKYSGRRR